jgi:hypothetical protein
MEKTQIAVENIRYSRLAKHPRLALKIERIWRRIGLYDASGQILQHQIVGEFESIRTNVVLCRRPEPPLIWHGADSRPAPRYLLAAVSCTLVMEPPHHPWRTVTRCSKSKALIEEYGSGLRHSFQNNVLVRQTLNLGT